MAYLFSGTPIALVARKATVMQRSLLRLGRIPAYADMVGRQLSSRLRCLPNTIIVGAQKAGTSSLYGYLTQHPDILGSNRKEVHYFDGGTDPRVDNFEKGEQWYRAHFPLKAKTSRRTRILEATPSYLFVPHGPSRIAALVPNVKMIVVLREPVERAISHYFYELHNGREDRPIMKALTEEEGLLEPIWRTRNYKSRELLQYSYKARGRYAEQLARFFGYFARDQLLILSSKSLFKTTTEALSRTLDFLGLNSDVPIPDKSARNVGTYNSPVEKDVIEYLENYFAPYNDDLFELLGGKLDW